MSEELKSCPMSVIGEQLRTQDNRCTNQPMFCVQQKRRIVGLSPDYSDSLCWRDSANDTTVYDDDPDFTGAAPEGEKWDKFGYIDIWETVMVAFTEEGCKEYLRQNNHNLKSPRIYVMSFNRCPEMIAIREFLMQPTRPTPALDKAREALKHISKFGHEQCKALCSADYIPRGRHAPDCPIEFYEEADEALALLEKEGV